MFPQKDMANAEIQFYLTGLQIEVQCIFNSLKSFCSSLKITGNESTSGM